MSLLPPGGTAGPPAESIGNSGTTQTASSTAGLSNAYLYNGLDQRTGKADSTGTFSYLLGSGAVDAAVLSDGAATYNSGLGLISEVRGGSSKFYQADALGSTRELTNAAGSVADTRTTDAFGNLVAATGSTPTPFGFVGQSGYQQDSDTGLMLLGHRYYDASTGRFISRDPIFDGYNWHAYAGNDPVNGIDPKGLDSSNSPWPEKPKDGPVATGGPVKIGGITIEPGGDRYNDKSKPPYTKPPQLSVTIPAEIGSSGSSYIKLVATAKVPLAYPPDKPGFQYGIDAGITIGDKKDPVSGSIDITSNVNADGTSSAWKVNLKLTAWVDW